MQAFLVLAGVPPGEAQARLDAAAHYGADHVPSLGGLIRSSVLPLPEIAGGWITWFPADRESYLLDQRVTEELAVLAFGEVSGQPRAAVALANVFSQRGADAVRKTNGMFTAVLLDRKRRRLEVVCDQIGRLAASYWANGRQLCVASHEVLLSLCGCPFEFDGVSAASVVGCDWSIGGKPLNRNIFRLGGVRGVSWSNGSHRALEYETLAPQDRLAPGDKRAIQSRVDEMVESVVGSARRLRSRAREVEAGVTAGLDSRAVLAALWSSFERDRIRLYTTGPDDSRDVIIGRRIAQRLDLRHEQRATVKPSADAFQAHDLVRAFMANGDTSSRGSLSPMPVPRTPGLVIAGGGGGEIVRGFYYRNARHARTPVEAVQALASRKFLRLQAVGLLPELVTGVVSRLEACFEGYARASTVREDWLDLFYIYERFARFGGVSARKQEAPRWIAFSDPDLIEMALTLPAPIGEHCTLHKELVRRYLPRGLYWTPLNGKHPPAWEGAGPGRRALRGLARTVFRLRQASTRTSPGFEPGVRPEQLFADALYDYIYALLTSPRSLAPELFGMSKLQSLLNEHRRRHNRLGAIGPLVNMEHFRIAYERAARAAVQR